MKPSFRTCALLLSLLGPVATRSAALGQGPVSAEALFNRGVEQMNAGNYESGCKDIAESQRLEPMPGTLFSLATCMDRWGHLATAAALYRDYLVVYENLPQDRKPKQGERPGVARAQREKLGPEVPELTLTLPPNAPAGTVVKRDGQEMAAAALGVALPVDPGEVVVTTQAPDGPVWEQRITIGKGERKKVALKVEPPRLPVASPAGTGSGAAGSGTPDKAVDKRNKTLIYAGIGASGGLAVVGIATAIGAAAAGNAGYRNWNSHGCPKGTGPLTGELWTDRECRADFDAKQDQRFYLGNTAVWTFLGAGAVGGATAVYALTGGKGDRAASGNTPKVAFTVGPQGGAIVVRGSL